jgi:hypothetical protein
MARLPWYIKETGHQYVNGKYYVMIRVSELYVFYKRIINKIR